MKQTIYDVLKNLLRLFFGWEDHQVLGHVRNTSWNGDLEVPVVFSGRRYILSAQPDTFGSLLRVPGHVRSRLFWPALPLLAYGWLFSRRSPSPRSLTARIKGIVGFLTSIHLETVVQPPVVRTITNEVISGPRPEWLKPPVTRLRDLPEFVPSCKLPVLKPKKSTRKLTRKKRSVRE